MSYSGGYSDGYADAGGQLAVAGVGSFSAAGYASTTGAAAFAGVGSFSATAAAVSVFGRAVFAGTGTLWTQGTLPSVDLYATVAFEGDSGLLLVSRFTGTDYRLLIVDTAGAVYAECENAKIGSVTTELNGPGALDFSLAITDPDALFAVPGREVQVWRGDQLLWWGPIVRPQAQLWEVSWQCAGLLWYFAHRYMGRADRQNLIVNGDFEADEAGWSFVDGVTHSVDFTRKVEGARSLKLTGATADHTQHASQTYTHVTQWSPPGDFVTVAAYVYIPSADYLGGAIEDLGLVAKHRNAAGTVLETATVKIDDSTERDVWLPIETGVANVKAGDTVEVMLFPPHGVANYDLVTVTLMESLSFFPGADITTIIGGIVDYAQDRLLFVHGKSDLNIDHATELTGIVRDVTYQFAEHRQISDALDEYVRQGLVDIEVALTPTTRTVTGYHPRKGAYRSDLLLELDTNVADFTWSWDGEAAASNVVVLGLGDGPDRPEGGATAATTFLDGLTLEWVESAPDDVTIGELDDRAAERLAVAIHPEIVEVTTLPGVGIIGQLQVGDTVPVNIQHGYVDIDHDVYRAVRISISPDTDQATITLNRTA